MSVESSPETHADTIAGLQLEVEQLKATAATQKATIDNLTAQKAQEDADEKLIAEKMGAGLTRDQAKSVLARQRAFDESPRGKQVAANNEAARRRKEKAAQNVT